MRKFAIALLRNPNPTLHSHAFKVRRDPASFLPFSTLATGESRPRVPNYEDGEVGSSKHSAVSEIAMGALETAKTKTRRPKADKFDKFEQDFRGKGGSLHIEIATGKAKTKVKARRKATANAEELNQIVAGEKATELSETSVVNTGKCNTGIGVVNTDNLTECQYEKAESNATTGTAEEITLHAKDDARIHKEFSEFAAKVELHTYRCSRQWEEVARKLLDYGIPLVHVIKMLELCKTLPCATHCVDPILQHFTELGMSHEEMGRTISAWPTILNITSPMFQSKVDFFETVGIDKRTLGKLICVSPLAIVNPLVVLKRHFDFWEGYMQDIQTNAACIMITRNSRLLTYNLHKTIKPKLAYLEEQGFEKRVLLKHSSMLAMSVESLDAKVKLLEQFGILDARKRACSLVVIHRISIPNLQARFNNLLASGFSLDQVQNIVLKCPQVLTLAEAHFNLKLNYAVDVMNLSLDVLAACPMYWTHSFENRIKYRYEVIKELQSQGARQKQVSLGYMVCMTDANFRKRFVEKLQDCAKHPNVPSV